MPHTALTPFDYAVFGIFYFFSIPVLIYPRFKNPHFSKVDLLRIEFTRRPFSESADFRTSVSGFFKISTFTENQDF